MIRSRWKRGDLERSFFSGLGSGRKVLERRGPRRPLVPFKRAFDHPFDHPPSVVLAGADWREMLEFGLSATRWHIILYS